MSWSRVRNLAMEAPFRPPVSAGLFWCLVFDVCPTVRLCGSSHRPADSAPISLNSLATDRRQTQLGAQFEHPIVSLVRDDAPTARLVAFQSQLLHHLVCFEKATVLKQPPRDAGNPRRRCFSKRESRPPPSSTVALPNAKRPPIEATFTSIYLLASSRHARRA
jgi:hypothetical protein